MGAGAGNVVVQGSAVNAGLGVGSGAPMPEQALSAAVEGSLQPGVAHKMPREYPGAAAAAALETNVTAVQRSLKFMPR